MPTYRWKGLNASGARLEGTLAADSESDVIAKLRGAGIGVTDISGRQVEPPSFGASPPTFGATPPAVPRVPRKSMVEMLAEARAHGGGPTPYRGLLITAGLFLAALAIGYITPITVCRCERTAGGAVDCTISERDLGLITIRQQSLAGVTSADIESKTSNERVDNDRNRIAWRENLRLVLGNAAGATIRPSIWEQRSQRVSTSTGHSGGEMWIGASTDTMRDTIARFIADSADARVSIWQGQMVPLAFPGVLIGLGVIALCLSVLGMFSGTTNLVYALAGRLAAGHDARQRGRKR